MSGEIEREDWDALIEVFDRAIFLLDGRKVQPVKESFLEFTTTAAMLGLEDLANAVTSMLDFLVKQVGSSWDEEAAATLSFTMASFREKMAAEMYSPAFSEGIKEILLFMDFFEKEEPEPQETAKPQAAPIPDAKAAAPQPVEPPPLPPESSPDEIAEIFELGTSGEEPAEPSAAVEEAPVDIEALLEFSEAGKQAQPPRGEETPEDIEALLHSLQPSDINDAAEEPVEPPRREEPSAFDLPDATPIGPSIPEETDRGSAVPADTLELYREMLRIDPTSAVFVHLAEELSTKGFWKETAEVCRRGLIHHPYNLRGRVLLGLALRETGESQEALATLAEVHREIRKNILLYRVLAEFAEEEGDLSRSERLMLIYNTLQGDDLASWGYSEGRPAESTPKVRPSTVKTGKSGVEEQLIEVLSHFLSQIEKRAPAVTPTRRLFSEGSRIKLKKALSSRIS